MIKFQRFKRLFVLLGASTCLASSVAAQSTTPQFLDDGERQIHADFTKETDIQKKIDLLDKWREQYPNSALREQRTLAYFAGYVLLDRSDQALAVAKELLTANLVTYSYYVCFLGTNLKHPSAEFLDLVTKAGNALVAQVSFTAVQRPANVPEATWNQNKSDLLTLAQNAVGWAAVQRNDAPAAKSAFRESLKVKPNQPGVCLLLGLAILTAGDPSDQQDGVYYLVRAGHYDGPESLAAEVRQRIEGPPTNFYARLHGDMSGYDALVMLAKSNPTPPPAFRIDTPAERQAEALLKATPATEKETYSEQYTNSRFWATRSVGDLVVSVSPVKNGSKIEAFISVSNRGRQQV